MNRIIMSMVLFLSCIYTTALANTVASQGVQNTSNYSLVYSTMNGSGASCSGSCYTQLAPPNGSTPGGAQWVNITQSGGWIDLQYFVCSSVGYSNDGKPICYNASSQAVPDGQVGVTFTQNGATLSTQDGGTVVLGPPGGSGKPYTIGFTANQQPTTLPTQATYSNLPYRGVNLSGPEYAQFTLPPTGIYNYFAHQGMNTIRLPFAWESIQPDLSKKIDFSTGNAKQLADLVTYYTDQKYYVILDMHNYMRYTIKGTVNTIGAKGSSVTVQQYANAWASFATQFKNNPYVFFDLMNEPNRDGSSGGQDLQTETILANYNTAIAAIRQAGFHNYVFLEGNNWSGLVSWLQTNWGDTANSAVFVPSKIQDPDNKYAINVHEYFDDPNGGGAGRNECQSSSSISMNGGDKENLKAFASWVQQNNVNVVLTELGGKNTDLCAAAIDTFLSDIETINTTNLKNNQGKFLGWTAWVADSNTSDDLNLVQRNGQEVKQMQNGFDRHLTPTP